MYVSLLLRLQYIDKLLTTLSLSLCLQWVG